MKTVLRPLFFLLLLMACNISAQGDGEYAETVYPEVWDWQPEQYKIDRSSNISAYMLDDGDVLISFFWIEESDIENKYRHEYFTFFGGQEFESLEEAFTTLQGSYDDRVDRRVKPYDDKLLINNSEINTKGPSSNCYRGFDTHLSIYDKAAAKYVVDKTILLFWRNSPVIYPKISCEDSFRAPFEHNLVVFSLNEVVPLRDNTFLVASDDLGTIVRFDENLNSRSSLLGSSLFAANYDDFYEFAGRFLNVPGEYISNPGGYGRNYPVILDELEQIISRSGWFLEIE